MAEANGKIDQEAFGEIARKWLTWRRALQASAHNADNPELTVLTELSRTKPTWQLAIASLAYIEAQSHEGGDRTNLELEEVAAALTSLPGRRSLSDFEGVAAGVSSLPYRTLIRGTPRFFSILHHGPSVSASMSIRLIYCMEQHPEGGPAFLSCLND